LSVYHLIHHVKSCVEINLAIIVFEYLLTSIHDLMKTNIWLQISQTHHLSTPVVIDVNKCVN